MVKRICDICKKEFKKKFDYDCHINRKYKCEPIIEINEKEDITVKNCENDEKNEEKTAELRCNYCFQTFALKYNLKICMCTKLIQDVK